MKDAKTQEKLAAASGREERIALAKERENKAEQNYKPIIINPKRIVNNALNIIEHKLEGYDNIYVSEKVKLKPKQAYIINRDLNEAIKAYGGIKSLTKPKISIVDDSEMGSFAIAKYDCVLNTIFALPQIGIPKEIVALQKGGACANNPKATMYHEVWHWMQAEEYRRKHGEITAENRGEYMKWLIAKCKKELDNNGLDEYNVDEICRYAGAIWRKNRFDEVDAEYNVSKKLRK